MKPAATCEECVRWYAYLAVLLGKGSKQFWLSPKTMLKGLALEQSKCSSRACFLLIMLGWWDAPGMSSVWLTGCPLSEDTPHIQALAFTCWNALSAPESYPFPELHYLLPFQVLTVPSFLLAAFWQVQLKSDNWDNGTVKLFWRKEWDMSRLLNKHGQIYLP